MHQSHFLLTEDGDLVFFDEPSRSLRHGPVATSPRNAAVRPRGDGGRQLVLVPAYEPSRAHVIAELAEQDPCAGGVTLVTLCPRGDGTGSEQGCTSFPRLGGLLPIQGLDLDALASLLRSAWLAPRSMVVLPKGAGEMVPGFRLKLGHLSLHLDAPEFPIIAQEETYAAGRRILRSIHVLSDGWKVERLELFAPLIYMTVFGPSTFFEAMALAVQSLEQVGRYTGDYLIISDRPEWECATFLEGVAPSRTRFARAAASGLRDITAARLCLDRERAADCQPVIYMDSDVICDADIQPFLVEAVGHHRILLATEFRGRSLQQVPDHITDWFGRFLSRVDHDLDSRFAACANSGIICARNADVLLGPLRTALAVWRSYSREHDLPAMGMDFDQPFINYALQKSGSAEFAVLDQATLCIYDQEPSLAEPPRGFVHFNSGVGVDKNHRMRSYLHRLLALSAEQLSAAE